MSSRVSMPEKYGDPYGTLVEPGNYVCWYRGVERGFAFGEERLFAYFTIAEEEDQEGAGMPLWRVYNAFKRAFVPRTHNMSMDFWSLTGRRPPATLKPDYFLKDCQVLASVVTVGERKQSRRAPDPIGPPYSKIDSLKRITLGTPPCLLRSGQNRNQT